MSFLSASKGAALGEQGNPYTSVAQAQNDGASRGLRFFANSSGVEKEVFYDPDNGGWILVASNDARDSTIPSGTSRHNAIYQLDRNGSSSSLGTPDPNQDYIIGDWYRDFSFSEVRGLGWGYSSTNGSFSYPNNFGGFAEATWSATSRDDVVNRNNVNVSGNQGISSGANYFVLDAIYKDKVTGGFGANQNQTTIGSAGVQSSNGDPSGGTYWGHGANEGSHEGWYDGGGGAADSQGYTTWVR